MKISIVLLVGIFSASVLAQTTVTPPAQLEGAPHRIRVYVTAMETRETRGLFSQHRQVLSGDQTTQTTETEKLFVSECPEVMVTVKQDKADYTFSLARQSASSRGLAGKRDKWTLADKDGDLIGGDSAHEIKNAVKDACTLIKADVKKSK